MQTTETCCPLRNEFTVFACFYENRTRKLLLHWHAEFGAKGGLLPTSQKVPFSALQGRCKSSLDNLNTFLNEAAAPMSCPCDYFNHCTNAYFVPKRLLISLLCRPPATTLQFALESLRTRSAPLESLLHAWNFP